MANPSPQHNPTDGLGVAAFVQMSGTGITGIGAGSGSSNHPVAQYQVSLNVSGSPNPATVVVTPSLVDVSNASYGATAGSWVYRSYNAPQITEASQGTFTPYPTPTNTAKIASVGASGASTVTVTALNPGQAVIEVMYPMFDNTAGNITIGNEGGPSAGTTVPIMGIYAQLIVTVGK